MTVTTGEAAILVGVSPATVRSWVMKGWLIPLPRLDPARRHHLFLVDHVVRCEYDHRPVAKRRHIEWAQAEWARRVASA